MKEIFKNSWINMIVFVLCFNALIWAIINGQIVWVIVQSFLTAINGFFVVVAIMKYLNRKSKKLEE